MSRRFEPPADDAAPQRLRVVSQNPLERRLLDAAAREQPSRELSERMALAIGITPPAMLPQELESSNARQGMEHGPELTLSRSAAASGARAVLPWIAGTTAILAVAGGVVVSRPGSAPVVPVARQVVSVSPPVPAPTAMIVTAPAISEAAVSKTQALAPVTPAPAANARARSTVPDLQAQIGLLDSARAALASGENARALELLRQYQGRYPAGAFRPEAAALRIEALSKLGRSAEARAQADRFLSEHAGSPLGERVQRITKNKQP